MGKSMIFTCEKKLNKWLDKNKSKYIIETTKVGDNYVVDYSPLKNKLK